MLANVVSETQESKLISQDWRITSHSWSKTLDKLENLEPTINKEETMRRSLSEWKHFQETGQIEHGGGNPNKRKGGNRHGGGKQKHSRNNNNNNDNEDPRGHENSPQRKCKNCGGYHPGRCNKPLGWIDDPKNPRAKYNKKGGWRDKNKDKNVTMTTNELNLLLSNARKGRNDESKSDDDGSVSLLDSRSSSSSRGKQPKEF